ALVEQALAGAARHELLGARARGHSLGGDADEPTRAALGRDRRAVERVDLLRRDTRDRRGLLLRVAGRDRHLGAERVLALAHPLGDVLGELLGLEARLAEDHLADDAVDDLLEARHARALLARAEVDVALELGRDPFLCAIAADADDLLDVGDTDARERDVHGRRGSLYVRGG